MLAHRLDVANLESGVLDEGDGLAEGRMCMSGAMYVSMNGPPPGAVVPRDICWTRSLPPGPRRSRRRETKGA
nr:hypothetical protein GCM10025732_30670 [Glycomyces mayteni]